MLVTIQMAGCIDTGTGVGNLLFSPNGSHICYVRENRIEEKVVDGKIWSRSINLHWCNTCTPRAESSIHIDTLGWAYKSYVNVGTEVKWSPLGSRIGVFTPYKVTIVDIASRSKNEIRDGIITNFAWIADGQLAYLTCRRCAGRERIVICRIDLDARQKTDVFAFPERPKSLSIGSGYWSPSGKYLIVIFMEPISARQYHCVNVLDGTIRAFGQLGAYAEGVAWAPDSTRAFCVSNKVGPGDHYEALLFDPETGVTVDCTAGFQRTFAGHAPKVVPLWTVDGEYVLVNTLKIGGHLVRAEPWESVPLGKMLAPRFSVESLSGINPRLFRLPVSGWVGVLPTGNEGNSPIKYVSDYSGRRLIPLLKGYPWSISQDGTMGATIGEDGHVEVHSLTWALPVQKLSPENREENKRQKWPADDR